MGDNQGGLWNKILGWYAHPFNTQGDAFNWVLTVGFLFIVVWGWNYILIKINAE